jgi:hypothetical protein
LFRLGKPTGHARVADAQSATDRVRDARVPFFRLLGKESGTRARLSSGCSGRRDASSPGRARRSQAPVEASAAAGNVVTANDPQLEGKTPNELDDMLDECEVPKGGVIPKECIDFD